MIPAILIYLFKANVALTLFFLAYRLGLRRLTFYTLNRVFLLCGIVCSSLFPLVSVNTFVERHETLAGGIAYLPDLSALTAPAERFTMWTVLVYVFWAGVAVMTVRLAIQLLSLWKIHRCSRPANVDGVPVRALQQQVNPFSFFRHIYINPSLHLPEERLGILSHEKVHVRQWHSADVVLGELNNIFYWFNPGAWLMKTAIRENLEFITDRHLLKEGVDKAAYQYSLIKVSGIPYATAIANNFNFSHLKNRIIMMNRKKSSTFQLVRYVALGAVVGGLVLSLNYSRASVGPQVVKAVRDSQERSLVLSLHYNKTSVGPEGVKAVRDSQPAVAAAPMGIRIVKEGDEVKVAMADAQNAPTAQPAATAKNAAPKANSHPSPAPQAKPAIAVRTGGEQPLYLLNDRVITQAEMNSLNPNDIESVNVFKGSGITDDVLTQYGEKARNGIVAIYTRTWVATGKKRFGAAPTSTVAGTATSGGASTFMATQSSGVHTGNAATNVKTNTNTNANTNTSTNTDSQVNVKIVAEGNPVANITSENAVSITADKIIVQDKKNTQKTGKQ
ncbi:Signal transducer regulating beta-lactamase production, contains metallopeptidase domain [Chitinophaga eiseniae]|uniref:Signal transducer regulating beta-lactamase production, contains metallopeptidase domain n=1 Tax=Chitinophaga eiseniae TaxID=634771 RepID=A0A1T4L7C1_9BACT|nr:M56 family metallopeptidase [Chitinophaga eiseniae]SJZ50411.1 Signal transducer regulating beta-lactamase production, contains metallopeptidase domain [Chitinophaga eiseniae]